MRGWLRSVGSGPLTWMLSSAIWTGWINLRKTRQLWEEKMTDRQQYAPGPAAGVQIRKDGEKWSLILVRELRH